MIRRPRVYPETSLLAADPSRVGGTDSARGNRPLSPNASLSVSDIMPPRDIITSEASVVSRPSHLDGYFPFRVAIVGPRCEFLVRQRARGSERRATRERRAARESQRAAARVSKARGAALGRLRAAALIIYDTRNGIGRIRTYILYNNFQGHINVYYLPRNVMANGSPLLSDRY